MGGTALAEFLMMADGGFESIHTRHHDIHENNIGMMILQVGDGIFTGSHPIYFNVAFHQQLAQGKVGNLGIVDHERLVTFMRAPYGLIVIGRR